MNSSFIIIKKKINWICDLIVIPIQNNLIPFILFYATGFVLTLLPYLLLNTKLLRISFFTWLFDIYIICLFLVLFRPNIRKWISIIIAVPFYLLAIVDVFCLITHKTNFNPEILNLIFDTNNREASEYINMYILQPHILLATISLFLFFIFIHLFYKGDKIVSHFLSSKTIISTITKSIITIIVLLCITISLPYRIEFIHLLQAKSIFEIDEHISYQALNTPFNNLIFGLKLRDIEKKELSILADFQKKSKIESCSFRTPEIVLIIGESYIKSHSQLYGYSKETTPYQKMLSINCGNGLLIPFTDVITTSNYTSIVFKNIFSLKSSDENKSWGNYPLFPVLFKKAGYHVSFITSQFVDDPKRDIFNLSGGLFLNNSDISALSFDCRNDKAPSYDEELLEYFDSLKMNDEGYNLIIFHLAGQHIDFYKRSPQKWKKFQVKDYPERGDVGEKEKAFIADYDNATLYNDYVVNEIVKRFEDKESVVIYMPDHGEGCYDDGHKLGRMPKGEYTKNILENEYNIPFWIWYSKKYQKKHPQICQQIKDARNRPFMTDDIPHLLLYLGGIKCHEYQEKKNLISPNYDTHRKRYLYGMVDYDSIMDCKSDKLD